MAKQPNLLLIMCDQLRADALGCYGNTLVHTPNIDRIARRGTVFTRGYSQTPVCMPARNGLIAGVNPFELGLLENSLSMGEVEHPLPKLIRDQGYFTAAVGKMHFYPTRNHYGFDRMLLSEEIPDHIQDDDYLLDLRRNGYGHVTEPHGRRSEFYYVPQTSELPERLHTTAWTAERTCELISGNRNRPFFIFTSFIKPHPPFDPCVPYDRMYSPDRVPLPVRREEELDTNDYAIRQQNDYKVNGIRSLDDRTERQIRSHYYGCVSQIDRRIGDILDTLEACGLSDDTLIVLTSDHGEMLGDHYSYGKRTFYEASARIPLIVSWPGRAPQGETRDHFALLQDIYATFVAAAGGELPSGCSGIDLLKAALTPERPFRDQIHAEIGFGPALKMMLRWDDYKFIYHVNGGKESLFDLKNDPLELTDIGWQNEELCRKCREEMAAYYTAFGLGSAVRDGKLVCLPEQAYRPQGFIDQSPPWPATVIRE